MPHCGSFTPKGLIPTTIIATLTRYVTPTATTAMPDVSLYVPIPEHRSTITPAPIEQSLALLIKHPEEIAKPRLAYHWNPF